MNDKNSSEPTPEEQATIGTDAEATSVSDAIKSKEEPDRPDDSEGGEAPPDDAAGSDAEVVSDEEQGAAPYDLAGELGEDREAIPSQKILIQNLTPVPQASIVLTSHDRIKRLARMAARTTCEFELNEGDRLYIVACPDEEHQEIQEQATADGCNNSSA